MTANDNTILNKAWRLRYLYKIVDKEGNLVLFKPNKAQTKLRKLELKLKKEKWRARIAILKARQLWMTTYKVIDWLDDTLFWENQNRVITAHTQEKQQEIFQKAKVAYENIPDEIKDPQYPWWIWKKPKPKYDSKTEYYFEEKNNRIKVTLDSRSWTPTGLHITELAFKDNAKEMMTGTLPSIPANASITIETTANWAWGYFFDFRNKHSDSKTEFECVFFPRYTDDNYTSSINREIPEELLFLKTLKQENWALLSQWQINWYIEKYEELWREVFQEFPSTPKEAFLTSWTPVFNVWIVRKLEPKDYYEDPTYKWLRIYDSKKQRALFWVDTAEWWADWDYSSISVRSIDMSLLAFYYARIPPDALCDVVLHLRGIYWSWKIGIERNNTWLVTIKTIQNWEKYKPLIPNLYEEKTIDKYTYKQTWKIWRHTNMKTRPVMISEYERAIRQWEITEVDERHRQEMYTFVYNEKNHKPEAMQWCHDDAIMAWCVCYQMRKEPVIQNKEYKRPRPQTSSITNKPITDPSEKYRRSFQQQRKKRSSFL